MRNIIIICLQCWTEDVTWPGILVFCKCIFFLGEFFSLFKLQKVSKYKILKNDSFSVLVLHKRFFSSVSRVVFKKSFRGHVLGLQTIAEWYMYINSSLSANDFRIMRDDSWIIEGLDFYRMVNIGIFWTLSSDFKINRRHFSLDFQTKSILEKYIQRHSYYND